MPYDNHITLKNIILCLFLLIYSSFEENISLNKVWEKQIEMKHDWQNFGYQYIQFTEDDKLLFLKGNGEIIKKYSYEISKDKVISLSNGENFGKILSLMESELVIEKEIHQGNFIRTILDSYISIKDTKIDSSIINAQKYILENKWKSIVISHSNDTSVVSMEFDQLNFNEGIMNIQGKGFEKKYLVETSNFKGSYSIHLEDKERPHKSDFFKIEAINLNEIQIVFYEIPTGKLILKKN